MIVFIAALLVLGSWGCRAQTATASGTRPLGFTPGSGPIRGGRSVLIDVEEPAAAIGKAAIGCTFGQHTASRGEYDATSARYVCRTPSHSRPESVPLTITVDGTEFRMPARYIYTTEGYTTEGSDPNNEVTYLLRGQKVNKLLDHEYVIVLDISHLHDVREGEEVTLVLPDEPVIRRPPQPNSPLDSSWSSAPVTLREDPGAGKGK